MYLITCFALGTRPPRRYDFINTIGIDYSGSIDSESKRKRYQDVGSFPVRAHSRNKMYANEMTSGYRIVLEHTTPL